MTAGRPSHEPNDITIAEVKALASLGLTQVMIGEYIGVSVTTLLKHYRPVMAKARVGRLRKVAETAYDMAVSGQYANMTMFYLKTQANWRETDRQDEVVSEETITKIEVDIVTADDLEKTG